MKYKLDNVKVNIMVECLGVIFILSNFSLNRVRTNGNYVKLVKERFKEYENHKVIEKFKELLEIPSFRYDAPVELMLCIHFDKEPSKELLSRMNMNINDYKELLKLINDFVRTSNIESFINEYKGYYDSVINQFKLDINEYNPVEYLFNFLGMESNKLNVILMFGVSTANYGITIEDELYCCIRPYKESRFKEEIDYAYDKVYMSTLLLHEFAHSFINPLTDLYKDRIDCIDINKFKETLDKNPYGLHKETVINETVIRTIECLYVKEFFNDKYHELKEQYIEEGFVYIPEVENVFSQYTKSRDRYKDIKEFYDRIIVLFEEV